MRSRRRGSGRAPRYVLRGPARGPRASGPGMAVPRCRRHDPRGAHVADGSDGLSYGPGSRGPGFGLGVVAFDGSCDTWPSGGPTATRPLTRSCETMGIAEQDQAGGVVLTHGACRTTGGGAGRFCSLRGSISHREAPNPLRTTRRSQRDRTSPFVTSPVCRLAQVAADTRKPERFVQASLSIARLASERSGSPLVTNASRGCCTEGSLHRSGPGGSDAA